MPSRIDDLGSSSSHQPTSDSNLQPLYNSTFDPVDFLNTTLSTTYFASNQSAGSKNGRLPQIQTASADIQALLSKLNAHNSRCSNSLIQLTDEILRSGTRLAYEVEILRGDVNSLYDVLTDVLREDVQKFVISDPADIVQDSTGGNAHTEAGPDSDTGRADAVNGAGQQEPDFITQLRMLGQVKARLESVIKVFGEAMQWSLPPSELSVTSSLISVSAPELAMVETLDDQRAGEVSKKLRAAVIDLLESDGGGYAGLEAATKRVDDLRNLASVWKGTTEEKARSRLVDSLANVVEDRRKNLEARNVSYRPRGDSVTQRSLSMPVRSAPNRTDSGNPATGFFKKLRDELYIE